MASLVTVQTFAARLLDGVDANQTERAQSNLDGASALIRAEAGSAAATWAGESTTPDIAREVCIRVAKRAFLNPEGATAESLDNYATTFPPDIYLAPEEKRLIRRAAGKKAVWTQSTTRSVADIPDVPGVIDPTDTSSSEESDPFAEGWGKA